MPHDEGRKALALRPSEAFRCVSFLDPLPTLAHVWRAVRASSTLFRPSHLAHVGLAVRPSMSCLITSGMRSNSVDLSRKKSAPAASHSRRY